MYRLLREKVTIFVSTAYHDEAERFQRLALLHQGKLLALGTPEDVKALYPGVILEVRCGDPRRASAVLREELQRATVGLFGDRVHVGSRDPEMARKGIEKALRNAAIPVSGVQPVEPTLEDVFIAVLSSDGDARA
ncbi:MAG: transporter related [Deltaproteobacteria bacterium]|nr:transporter related [Deltaproteobacteria bacterium]